MIIYKNLLTNNGIYIKLLLKQHIYFNFGRKVMHNLDNQTILETSVATQTKVLLPQSFIEVEKVISTQPSKVHPIHSHKHYEIYFLTKGSRRLLFDNSFS